MKFRKFATKAQAKAALQRVAPGAVLEESNTYEWGLVAHLTAPPGKFWNGQHGYTMHNFYCDDGWSKKRFWSECIEEIESLSI